METNDIIGHKFGKLLVKNYLGLKTFWKIHQSCYSCQCECGKTIEVPRNSLISGNKQSCGCAHWKIKIDDIIGKKFGKLTVIEYIGHGKYHLYLCKCDCGKTTKRQRKGLATGKVKSCGCLKTNLSNGGANDLIGRRFGKLVVKEFLWSNKDTCNKNKPFYRCVCDCGKDKIISRGNLLHDHTKSCGCLKNLKGKENKDWKGYEGITGRFWYQLKINATRRKTKILSFDLTIEYVWKLFQDQKEKCALTGMLIELPKGSKKNYTHTASLDRINSDLGYVVGNVQWVHKDINSMKSNFTEKRFKELCRLVAEKEIHCDNSQ